MQDSFQYYISATDNRIHLLSIRVAKRNKREMIRLVRVADSADL